MHSYEEPISNHISAYPEITRKQIMDAFPHLAPKTVYNNVNKLKHKNLITEDKFGRLSPTKILTLKVQDDWPIHPVLQTHQNITEITNAYVNQDDLFLEWCIQLSHKYGTELTLMLTDLMIILATIQKTDNWKAYDNKAPINRKALLSSQNQLEEMLQQYEPIPISQAS